VRRRSRLRRRYVLPVLGCFLLAASVLTIPSSAWAFNNDGASSSVINGVPDVTGFENAHGSISLARLQAAAPGTLVSAATVSIDGLDRGYLLITAAPRSASILPARPTVPVPLIVVLGGINASPTQEAERDELLPLVEQGKADLVYPAGYAESWDIGVDGCCGPAASARVNDLAFVQQVTLAVRDRLHSSATYLIGFSNGGKLGYQAMCSQAALFQAFVAVSAMPLASCPNEQPRPIMVAVGAKDTELPLLGHSQPIPLLLDATLATWRDYDRCSGDPSSVGIGTALETTWDCASGTRVASVLYGGLDHEWPTAGLVGADVSGAKLIWAFLSGIK
jgi:poly(3-hydroxybutyrate) depolymerase